jgi:hypothetical protein
LRQIGMGLDLDHGGLEDLPQLLDNPIALHLPPSTRGSIALQVSIRVMPSS